MKDKQETMQTRNGYTRDNRGVWYRKYPDGLSLVSEDLSDVLEDCYQHAEEIRKEAVEQVLRDVENILPYGTGFTGRFYTLKDELLESDNKQEGVENV